MASTVVDGARCFTLPRVNDGQYFLLAVTLAAELDAINRAPSPCSQSRQAGPIVVEVRRGGFRATPELALHARAITELPVFSGISYLLEQSRRRRLASKRTHDNTGSRGTVLAQATPWHGELTQSVLTRLAVGLIALAMLWPGLACTDPVTPSPPRATRAAERAGEVQVHDTSRRQTAHGNGGVRAHG